MAQETPANEPTLKIKLNHSIVSNKPWAGGTVIQDYPAGAVVEWPEAEARRFIERGTAEEVDPNADVWLPGNDFVPARDPVTTPKYHYYAD